MWRPLSLVLVGATTSFMTSVYHGAGIAETLIVGVVSSNATLIVWSLGVVAAERRFRPVIDAATIAKGVCPACRTFNSLEEVTSADPETRCAHCHACDERFAVSVQHGRLSAERLGKFED